MSQELSQSTIIDGHVHLGSIRQVDRLLEVRRGLGFQRMNPLSIVDPRQGSGNSTVLAAKALHPEAFYAFGGLDHAASRAPANPVSLALQAQRLWEAGCDGIKMLETKPTTRRSLGQPIDGPYYEEYFALVEEQQIPLLWHVADPEEFWDPKTTPWWAAKHDWGYGPADVAKETLYAEVARVLDQHPGLRVVFAHLYFLSAELPRLERFLASYPNANIDLALGVELEKLRELNPPACACPCTCTWTCPCPCIWTCTWPGWTLTPPSTRTFTCPDCAGWEAGGSAKVKLAMLRTASTARAMVFKGVGHDRIPPAGQLHQPAAGLTAVNGDSPTGVD